MKDSSIQMDEVIHYSKMIGAHDLIMDLSGGYDFYVSERGSNLSSGQRQLISFVRLLIFRPDILILDEATSNIDIETENIIQYAIEQVISKRTSIIIAHRLSTIRHADKIIVLQQVEIIEKELKDELVILDKGHSRR